jgi:hypothetical protein
MENQSQEKDPGKMTIKDLLLGLTIGQLMTVLAFLVGIFIAGIQVREWLSSHIDKTAKTETLQSPDGEKAQVKPKLERRAPEVLSGKPPEAEAVQGDHSPIIDGNSGVVTIETENR